MRQWWAYAGWLERLLPFVLVGILVVAAVSVARLAPELFDGDRPYSLCPDNRTETRVLDDARVLREGADYSGRGPHYLIVDGPSGAEDALPESWVVPREPNHAYRTDRIELVVCEYRYAVGDEGELATCGYTPVEGGPTSTFTILSSRWSYRVFEASTGRQLASFTLEGINRGCADFRTLYGEREMHSTSPAEPDYDELRRELRPLVTGRV